MTSRIVPPAVRVAAGASETVVAPAALPWPAPRRADALPRACRDAVADNGRIRVGAAFRIAAVAR